MDYSAPHTLYVCGAVPPPRNVAPDTSGRVDGPCTADAEYAAVAHRRGWHALTGVAILHVLCSRSIFWKDRLEDAAPTSARVHDAMPLGEMGFVADPGRPLESLLRDCERAAVPVG